MYIPFDDGKKKRVL